MNRVCMIGLGYIGLPTGVLFAHKGKKVVGVDIRPEVVDTINRGEMHIEEPGLEEMLRDVVASGALRASLTPVEADVFLIAVPTPITDDKKADLGAVKSAARSLAPFLRRGNLVVLESTSPPRTTEDVVRPILEEISGLKAGADFMLAYSPERVLPGKIVEELRTNARVVGGIDEASGSAAKTFYGAVVEGEIFQTTATTAEMVKLMENTFRDINIAAANEFALVAEHVGINVWEAIALANHHPRVNILSPGPGVGGHCIAVDPWFLVEAAPDQAKLILLSRQTNDGMPGIVLDRVRQMTAGIENPRIACFGLAFKANIDDTRESPALDITLHLIQEGYDVRACDPHVASHEQLGNRLTSQESALDGADLLLLLVNHSEFSELGPEVASGMRTKKALDTRGALKPSNWPGFEVSTLGG